MAKPLVFFLLIITMGIHGQQKKDIKSILASYEKNHGSTEYGKEYITHTLNPALLQLESHICTQNEFGLIDDFLKMLLHTKDSTNELPANVLAGIFICKPEPIDKYISQLFPERDLVDLLAKGFKNRTNQKEKSIKNYDLLQKRLQRLIQLTTK